MTQTRQHTLVKLAFAALFIGLLAWAVWLAPVAEAGLPVRDTPTPTRETSKGNSDDDKGPLGAYMELQVQPIPLGAWSVVQWQDSSGGWQDVKGWHSSLDNGYQRWWVHEKDFGDGPFRWVVIQGKDGSVLGTSELFTLPAGADATAKIIVTIK